MISYLDSPSCWLLLSSINANLMGLSLELFHPWYVLIEGSTILSYSFKESCISLHFRTLPHICYALHHMHYFTCSLYKFGTGRIEIVLDVVIRQDIPSFYMNVGHFSEYLGHPNNKFQTFLKNFRVQVGVYL